MSPSDTRDILTRAAGARIASRLIASWATALKDYPTDTVRRTVETWIATHGQAPTLGQVRAALGAR